MKRDRFISILFGFLVVSSLVLVLDERLSEAAKSANPDRGAALRVPVAQPSAERLIPVREDDERVRGTPAFVRLGSMYQVGNVIWSGAAKREQRRGIFDRGVDLVVKKMNQPSAEEFCQNLGGGARLPTREEYEALARAMGAPNHYDRNVIPDMVNNWFWSSSIHPSDAFYFYYFYGNGGGIYLGHRSFQDSSVRCVIQQ